MTKKRNQRSQSGFTLLEMLLVIAMIGVLSAIALASYDSHITSSNRQAARAALLFAQQSMERQHLQNGTYVGATRPKSNDSHYELGFQGEPTENSYVLKASLKPADTQCGDLTLDNTGARGSTKGDAKDCWQ